MSIPGITTGVLLAFLVAPGILQTQELLDRHPLSPARARLQPLSQTLQELAGDNAERCGRVPFGHDPQPWTDCARKAFREGRAFYVRYDVDPLTETNPETEGAFGIASDGSGLVYEAEYWVEWWRDWLQPTALITDHTYNGY